MNASIDKNQTALYGLQSRGRDQVTNELNMRIDLMRRKRYPEDEIDALEEELLCHLESKRLKPPTLLAVMVRMK